MDVGNEGEELKWVLMSFLKKEIWGEKHSIEGNIMRSVVFCLTFSSWAYLCGDVLAVMYVGLNLRRKISSRDVTLGLFKLGGIRKSGMSKKTIYV